MQWKFSCRIFRRNIEIQLFKDLSSFSKGSFPDVLALPFKNIISFQDHGSFFKQGLGNILSAYPGLQIIKSAYFSLRKRQDLTIKHRPVGNNIYKSAKLRIFIGHQLFSPAPNDEYIISNDYLRMDAIPCEFCRPVMDMTERVYLA